MPRPAVLAATALALSACLGGCSAAAPEARPRGRAIAVVLDDFSMTPQRIRARPGRLTFRVANRGRINHTLVLQRGDQDTDGLERSLRPGGRRAFTLAVRPGSYAMLCTIANHEELGVSGTLTVR